MDKVRRLISDHLNKGDATGWFEKLYAGAQQGDFDVPWARHKPDPSLIDWLNRKAVNGQGKTALVVGCGLGDDAEALSAAGFNVTAFDISETAISWCKQRFPDSRVQYVAADLFNAPPEWSFDFVLEDRTIQSLPWDLCEPAIKAIASFVAPGGMALVLCLARNPEEDRRGIPWPLSRLELAAFEKYGLKEQHFEENDGDGSRRFLIEYIRGE